VRWGREGILEANWILHLVAGVRDAMVEATLHDVTLVRMLFELDSEIKPCTLRYDRQVDGLAICRHCRKSWEHLEESRLKVMLWSCLRGLG
jgi:hypothetical protein